MKQFVISMFKDRRFWRSMLALALPIALQNLLTSSFAMVDTLMIGDLGEETVAAVGLAAQIAFLLNLFLFGVCSGGSVFAAQSWGAKNLKSIKTTYGIILMLGSAICLLFFCGAFFAPKFCMRLLTNDEAVVAIGTRYIKIASFSYFGTMLTAIFGTMLRTTEQVRIPLYSNIVAVLANVVFNYVLIFGKFGFPRMGVEGAALATVISASVNAICIFGISVLKKQIIFCSPRDMFSFNKKTLVSFLAVAAPVFFNEALWSLGTTCNNAVFGRMGSGNYAALTISRTVENFVFVFFVGLCSACAVLIGKSVGENDVPRVKLYAKRFLLLEPLVGIVLGGILLCLRSTVLSLFDFGDASYNTAYLLLTIYCLEQVFRNLPYITIVGCFRAGGDTKKGMLYDLTCLWFIALPVTAVCGLVLKVDFVTTYIIALLTEDVIKNVLCVRHFFSFKWIRPTVANRLDG